MSSFLSRLAAKTPGEVAQPETAQTLTAIAVDAVIDKLLAGKPLDVLVRNDGLEVVCSLWLDDRASGSVIFQVAERLEQARRMFPTCEGPSRTWELSTCSNLVSFEIRQKVLEVQGEEDWAKCEDCTCFCMYDTEFNGRDDFCDYCNNFCCSRCDYGCTCPDL